MNRLASAHASFVKPSFSTSSQLDQPADFQNWQASSGHGATRLAKPTCKAAAGVALFAPMHYERRYAYPLLVWLHGEGSSERELRQLMPNVSVRNYVGAAVRGMSESSGSAKRCSWRQAPDEIEAAAEAVSQCIEHAERRYNIHPGRIFLAGRDSGGTMALRLALQYPLPIAGAASLGGALPRGGCLLAHVDRARQVPILLSCARESQIYPSAHVAEDLRLLHAAGCKLAIREYLCGDELFTDMFADLDHWMMQLVCGTPSAALA